MINRVSLKKLFIYAGCLLILDLVFSYVLWKTDTVGVGNLDGSHNEPRSAYILQSYIMSLVLYVPLLSLLLGAILAIFLGKELPYRQRYKRAFVLVVLFFYGLVALSGAWQTIAFLTTGPAYPGASAGLAQAISLR